MNVAKQWLYLAWLTKNIQEIDEQYRAYENLVSIDEIEKLMKIYKIGKAPFVIGTGIWEVTIMRYLSGQIPSKEYSDIIRAAISSHRIWNRNC